MVDVVRATLEGVTLLPACGQRAETTTGCGGGVGSSALFLASDGTSAGDTAVVGFEHVVGEDATVMLVAGRVGLTILGMGVDGLVGGRPMPGGGASVVVDVIGAAQRIDTALPAVGKRAVLVLVGVEVAGLSVVVGRRLRGRTGVCSSGSLCGSRGGSRRTA